MKEKKLSITIKEKNFKGLEQAWIEAPNGTIIHLAAFAVQPHMTIWTSKGRIFIVDINTGKVEENKDGKIIPVEP